MIGGLALRSLIYRLAGLFAALPRWARVWALLALAAPLGALIVAGFILLLAVGFLVLIGKLIFGLLRWVDQPSGVSRPHKPPHRENVRVVRRDPTEP